jgi:hypothetical protein
MSPNQLVSFFRFVSVDHHHRLFVTLVTSPLTLRDKLPAASVPVIRSIAIVVVTVVATVSFVSCLIAVRVTSLVTAAAASASVIHCFTILLAALSAGSFAAHSLKPLRLS